jgi:hypothetical protein
MILEEIEGSVKVTFAGKTLSIGDSADDYSKAVLVIGTGKAIFRLDPSSTFEVKGVEVVVEETPAPAPAPAPAPVEAAPVAERIPEPVETPSPVAEETITKK